jgi:hypothetical protein
LLDLIDRAACLAPHSLARGGIGDSIAAATTATAEFNAHLDSRES